MKCHDWQTYDPTWLVQLAREQLPEEPWLAEALANCTRCCRESDAYIRFVDASRPNEPGSAWQIDTSLHLESPREGWLALDILTGRRIGGVEFVDKL